jgi:hypothetical protein
MSIYSTKLLKHKVTRGGIAPAAKTDECLC